MAGYSASLLSGGLIDEIIPKLKRNPYHCPSRSPHRDVANTAAAATGDRVIAYPLKAKEIKDSEREAAVEDLREAAAGKPIDCR